MNFRNPGQRPNVFSVLFDRLAKCLDCGILPLEGFIVILLARRHLMLAFCYVMKAHGYFIKDVLDAVQSPVSIHYSLLFPKLPNELTHRAASYFHLIMPFDHRFHCGIPRISR